MKIICENYLLSDYVAPVEDVFQQHITPMQLAQSHRFPTEFNGAGQ